MYDQTPAGSLSSPVLKTYGLLKSIRGSPDMWRPVFVPGCEPSVTATTFLNKLVVNFSLSDVKKKQEIDVFYHFTDFIQSLDLAGLGKTLKWAVGATTIPPLGLPKKISVQFLHGCTPGCKCRPTTSTCDIDIYWDKIPTAAAILAFIR